MEFNVKETDAIKRQVTVTVTSEELIELEKKISRNFQKHAALPGFRKGKAPLGLVKKSYQDSIRSELMETALSENYNKVLDEIDFNPISQGKITDIKFEDIEKGLVFDIEFEIPPKVELKKYKGIKVEKEKVAVTDDMIDHELEHMREHFATVKPVEKAEEGNMIKFNAQLLGEGDVPVVGRKYEDVSIKIGSGDFDAELEKQMIGLELDQDAILRKTTPPAADAADQSPVTESYEITVTSLEERELPELDDDFVQNLQDDSIENLDQLKEKIRENMESTMQRRSQQQLNNRIVDEILKENPFEVPEAMINNYLNHVVQDFRQQFGSDKDFNEDTIRQRYRVDAIHAIRWYLVKEELLEKEKMAISEDDVMAKIEELPYSDEEKKQLRENEDLKRRIQDDLLDEKLFKFLEENAKVIEVEPKPDEHQHDHAH